MWSEANGDVLVKMREELNEDPQRMENHVRLLAEWIACKPYMPQNYDKTILKSFLRFSKQDLQRAKKKLEAFFALVTYNKAVFNNVRLSFESYIADLTTLFEFCVSPNLTSDGNRLTFLRIKESAKDGFSTNYYKLLYFTESLKFFHGASRFGDEYIMDARHFTASIVTRMTSAGFFEFANHFQSTYPVRYRRIVFTNTNVFMGQFITICKPVLGRKMRDRMIFRTNNDISDLYPRAMLPQEFGGDLGPMSVLTNKYMDMMRDNLERFVHVEERCKLTGAIPEEYKCKFDGGFGIDGSFRKLDLD